KTHRGPRRREGRCHSFRCCVEPVGHSKRRPGARRGSCPCGDGYVPKSLKGRRSIRAQGLPRRGVRRSIATFETRIRQSERAKARRLARRVPGNLCGGALISTYLSVRWTVRCTRKKQE